MYDEYIFTTSEIAELEGLLADMPEDMVIERMGLEARLEQAKSLIAGVEPPAPPKRAYFTFRGNPVLGSHGVVSDFGGLAVAAISEAVALVRREQVSKKLDLSLGARKIAHISRASPRDLLGLNWKFPNSKVKLNIIYSKIK